jgi:hypothetical protein
MACHPCAGQNNWRPQYDYAAKIPIACKQEPKSSTNNISPTLRSQANQKNNSMTLIGNLLLHTLGILAFQATFAK